MYQAVNEQFLTQLQDGTNFARFGVGAILLGCLFWTNQVYSAILHTTTAGAVASWWTGNNLQGVVSSSLVRALTTTLAFGSLVVAGVQTLELVVRVVNNSARESDRERNDGRYRGQSRRDGGKSMVTWLLEKIKELTEYLNSWAFLFVAMYGFSYVESGRRVAHLVRERGWSSFVSDRLVYRVFALAKVGVSLTTGLSTAVFSLMTNIPTQR